MKQPPTRPAYKRLTQTQEALIVNLSRDGFTQTQIAQQIGCSQPAVSDVLRAFEDTRDLARLKLRNAAQRLAERVIINADVDQSLEVLDRLEVAPKRQIDSSRDRVTILIGMPNHPAGPNPFDVSPQPFAIDAPPQGAVSE